VVFTSIVEGDSMRAGCLWGRVECLSVIPVEPVPSWPSFAGLPLQIDHALMIQMCFVLFTTNMAGR